MNQDILAEVHKTGLKTVPEIRAGYTVRVHQKIKEGGKKRIQVFEGLVIKVSSGTGLDKTFTVRKLASGIGVEKIFPVYSSNIDRIEIVKKAKTRRSKMYYMRERTGKAARLRETYLKEGDAKMLEHEEEAPAPEEVPAEQDADDSSEAEQQDGSEADVQEDKIEQGEATAEPKTEEVEEKDEGGDEEQAKEEVKETAEEKKEEKSEAEEAPAEEEK